MKRKVEEFIAYDEAGTAHTLVVWQHYMSAATKGDPGRIVDTLREVRTGAGHQVNRVSDDEHVIFDPHVPGGLKVRRRP